MVAAVVTANNTRINDMESLTVGQTISSIGGGAGAGLENTIYLQGANSIGRKVTDTAAPGSGFYSTPTTAQDMSTGTGTYQTAMFKFNVTTSPDLQSLANNGLILRLGSDASNYEQYTVEGFDTYPARGGWRVLAIDPNIAGYVDDSTNGTPVLTAIQHFGIAGLFTAGGAKDLNVLLDAIDIGSGLRVTGGTGVDPDATFQDFVDFDEGNINNRFGYAFTNAIGLEVNGTLEIGNGATTVFTDADKVVSFADGRFAAGFAGLALDIGSPSDAISWTSINFLGKGNTTVTDTRPVLNVTGTSGVHNATTCLFDAFAAINLTSACTYDTCSITNSGPLTPAGADVRDSTILAPTVAADTSALIWDVATDPNGLLDRMSIAKGAAAHHAIEFGTNSPLTMTLEGIDFSGFNATDGQNDSTLHIKRTTGTVTINLSNCTGNISYKSDGATVVLQASVPVTVTVLDDTTGLPIANTPRVLIYNDSTKVAIDSAAVDANGVYSYSYTGATPLAIGGWVREQDLSTPDYVTKEFSGTIDANGFSITIRLEPV